MEAQVKKTEKRQKILKLILNCALLLIWVFAANIASQFIIAYPMYWILGDNIKLPVWTAVYSALAYTLALALIVFVPWKVFKKWKTNREELGLIGWPTWTDLGLAPIGFIASLIAAYILTAIFSFFPWFNVNETQNVGFNFLISGGDRVIAFITLVIIAPIAEEIIFRGWLYGKLRAKLSMPIAMILTSLLFGILHGQWNVGVNVFALSIVLCGLREVTGTIYSGIVTHMIKNAVAFFLLYVMNVGI